MERLAVVILAAGQGIRMRSKTQKILHEVGGRPMVAHIFEAARTVADLPPVLVIGPGEGGMQALFGDQADYVVQPEQLGTGQATMMAELALRGRAAQVLVAYGDMPLLRAETMAQLAQRQAETNAALTMLTVIGDPASSFGRVVRGNDDQVIEIVEVAEAKQRPDAMDLLAIRELNAGVYCFDAEWLWLNLPHLPLRQARSGQEYYLTDMVGMAVAQGRRVDAIVVADPDECLGAGTRSELVVVEKAFRRRTNDYWLTQGVTLMDPQTTYIDQTTKIGQDTIIWPNSYLLGSTDIGEDCVIGPNTIIRDASVGRGCRIVQAVVEKTSVDSNTVIEPFSHLIG